MTPKHPHPEPSSRDERLAQLLADQALGLTSVEQDHELSVLLSESPVAQGDSFEEAAAMLALAQTPPVEVPAALRERLVADAERYAAPTTSSLASGPARRSAVLAFVGGVLSAAAVVVLMLVVRQGGGVAPTPDVAYERFVQTAGETDVHPWVGAEADYKQVHGSVVWSDDRQGGYMGFEGLTTNDSLERQYQLWIVDPSRDALPVDGGVFDVEPHLAADGKAYVPFSAKLQVDHPVVFAVTLEKPGGVVKSAGPLLVVAAVEQTS